MTKKSNKITWLIAGSVGLIITLLIYSAAIASLTKIIFK